MKRPFEEALSAMDLVLRRAHQCAVRADRNTARNVLADALPRARALIETEGDALALDELEAHITLSLAIESLSDTLGIDAVSQEPIAAMPQKAN